MKSGRFLQIKATYYNTIRKKKINIIVKDSCKLIPMALRKFGKCFKLDVSKEVMPYNVYTYENVTMGACSIQSALGILKDGDKQQFLDNLKNGVVSYVKVWIVRCLIQLNIQVFTVTWIVKY